MKLNKRQILLISFMLFSLFFGAGNLIFPPFLGQNAGSNTPMAIAFFLITAVALPVLGVLAVANFGGLDQLAGRVNKVFAVVFTVLIYLSIGPGLGIPRAASVPFEMAVAPYLNVENPLPFMVLYSAIFFMIATWLALNPSKLVERIGKFLTPSLLTLISILFISFLIGGKVNVASAQGDYATNPAVVGFLEGYNTMDAIAALNFGLVISVTIRSFGIDSKKGVMHYTLLTGIFAGTILSTVYLMLSYLGMSTSGLYPIHDNGAWTLRCIVQDVFGEAGAILLASIFTLACLTTCVGLITSISQYFSTLIKKVTYRQLVFFVGGSSFLICNLGLNMILSISIPVLNMIYPISIVLILLGVSNRFIENNRFIYPLTIFTTAIVSVVYALEKMHITFGFVNTLFHKLPFYDLGMGWSLVALVSMLVALVLAKVCGNRCSKA